MFATTGRRNGLVLMTIVLLLNTACGGGGGDSVAQVSGLLTMGSSKDTISVDISQAAAADETADISFEYSAYGDNRTALPVVVSGYQITYERQDCSGCPTPANRYVASDITLKAGDKRTNTVTLLTAADKAGLPITALKTDNTNPILNQTPVTPENHSVKIATAASVPFGQMSPSEVKTFSFGLYDGVQTSFTASLSPPVLAGSVIMRDNGNPIATDNGTGAISGTNSGNVLKEAIATADGSARDFSFRINGGIIPGSATIRASGNVVATDNGSGQLVGAKTVIVQGGPVGTGDGSTSTFQSKAASNLVPGSLTVKLGNNIVAMDNGVGTVSGAKNVLVQSQALTSGDGTTKTFQGRLNSGIAPGSVSIEVGANVVATDSGAGVLSGTGVTGTVNYTTGSVTLTFTTAPAAQAAITSSYTYSASVTGTVNYTSGLITLTFTPPPSSNAAITMDYNYNASVSGSISYSTGSGLVSFAQAPALGSAVTVDYGYSVTLTGAVDYTTGRFSLRTSASLHAGDSLSVDYSVNGTSGTIKDGTITFPAVTFAGGSTPIIKGTVIIMLDQTVIGRDDGKGNITSSSGAFGTVNYQEASVTFGIKPAPTSGVLTAHASLGASTFTLSPTPIVNNSVSVQWGDVTCSEKGGVLQSPCTGTVDHLTGVVNLTAVASSATQNKGVTDVVVTYQVNVNNVMGGEFLATGDGATKSFSLNLKYAPIAPPQSGYALTIQTTGGLNVTQTTGGLLSGDVCASQQSIVNNATGAVSVCFSRPLAADERMIAFYRTSGVLLKAVVTAQAHEVGGRDFAIKKEVAITIK